MNPFELLKNSQAIKEQAEKLLIFISKIIILVFVLKINLVILIIMR